VEGNDKRLFRDDFDDLIAYANQKIFKLNEDFTEQDIRSIYE